MAKDASMLSVGRNRALFGLCALGFVLGAPAACGSSATQLGREPDAGTSGRDAGVVTLNQNGSGSGTGITGSIDAGGVFASPEDGGVKDGGIKPSTAKLDAQPDVQPAFVGCVADGLDCTAGEAGVGCCYGSCDFGMCGSCLAEGAKCDTNIVGQQCCNELPCNGGSCGTALCVPDTTPCTDPSVVCCNDNCNNGTCGG